MTTVSTEDPQFLSAIQACVVALMDICMRHALAIEDQFSFLILTRVKVAEAAEANA